MKINSPYPVYNGLPRLGALLMMWCPLAGAADLTELCISRTAVERVYHEHRLGQKAPFEQASPPALIERLVREDLRKEAALRQVYGVEISSAQLDAEVRRIETTTRSPETLAEIKQALGNDPEKIAGVFAKPFLVERLLRERFENDDSLHAPQRRIAEEMRSQRLGSKEGDFAARLAVLKEGKDGEVQEPLTWELTPRPADDTPAAPAPPAAPTQNKASSGLYSVEATAQLAQVLSSPEKARENKDRKLYIEDLHAKLREGLLTQLQKPGDISAVIETPGAFQIYLAKERTPSQLITAVFTLRKRGYGQWLGEQPDP